MDDEGLHSYKAIAFISNTKRIRLNNDKSALTLKKKFSKQKNNRQFSKLGEIYG
jgi:hypothetical protein